MTVHMQVVLADYAVTHDGKVMMAGAGWSQVGSGPFASALAFIVKVPWDMANQQIAIHAELVDEDGRPVLVNQSPLSLDIGFSVGRPDGLRPGSDIDQTSRSKYHRSLSPRDVVMSGAYRLTANIVKTGTGASTYERRKISHPTKIDNSANESLRQIIAKQSLSSKMKDAFHVNW